MSPRSFAWATVIFWLWLGSNHTFGPDQWRSSPSYTVITGGGHIPLRLWGVLFLVIGVGQALSLLQRRRRWPLAAGAATAAAWSASFLVAALPGVGKLTGAGGPPLWFLASVCHLFQGGIPTGYYRRSRRRRS